MNTLFRLAMTGLFLISFDSVLASEHEEEKKTTTPLPAVLDVTPHPDEVDVNLGAGVVPDAGSVSSGTPPSAEKTEGDTPLPTGDGGKKRRGCTLL